MSYYNMFTNQSAQFGTDPSASNRVAASGKSPKMKGGKPKALFDLNKVAGESVRTKLMMFKARQMGQNPSVATKTENIAGIWNQTDKDKEVFDCPHCVALDDGTVILADGGPIPGDFVPGKEGVVYHRCEGCGGKIDPTMTPNEYLNVDLGPVEAALHSLKATLYAISGTLPDEAARTMIETVASIEVYLYKTQSLFPITQDAFVQMNERFGTIPGAGVNQNQVQSNSIVTTDPARLFAGLTGLFGGTGLAFMPNGSAPVPPVPGNPFVGGGDENATTGTSQMIQM